MRFDDIRPGGYDPAARLEEMDRDGVDAEVLYPTPRLSQAIFANTDAELPPRDGARLQRLDLRVRRRTHPSGSRASSHLPNRGVDGAVAEIERVSGPARHAWRQ